MLRPPRLVADGEGRVLVFEEAFCDREAEPASAVGVGCWGSADARFEDVGEEVGVDSGVTWTVDSSVAPQLRRTGAPAGL